MVNEAKLEVLDDMKSNPSDRETFYESGEFSNSEFLEAMKEEGDDKCRCLLGKYEFVNELGQEFLLDPPEFMNRFRHTSRPNSFEAGDDTMNSQVISQQGAERLHGKFVSIH